MTAAGFTFPGKRRDDGREQAVSPHDRSEYPEAQQRCTCTLGCRCGPDGCECTTPVMGCPVHYDTEAGRLERAIMELGG